MTRSTSKATKVNAKRKNPEQVKTSMFADMLRQVRKVPRGKVATYGDVAYAAGYPGAARQVAWALHAESAGLPWHRIVGAGGTILLPGEQGFEQRMHLQAEGVGFLGLKVNMVVHRHSFFPQINAKKKLSRQAAKSAPRKSARQQI
ncbi:MAG TPA: MGMT family protein [Candidatus Saccharimonadales bacterium]|nr:MGMT family protein [Candidatus Saccharimonadales bacterium]